MTLWTAVTAFFRSGATMSRTDHSEQLATIRDEARILVQRAGDHEDDLQALVATADMRVQHAEEALSDALDGAHESLVHLQALLSTQLQRSQDGAETARELWARAHEQRVAAGLLLAHIDHDLAAERHREHRIRQHAVLVVDDHGSIREVIADELRNAGFVVRTAANGLEGLLAAYEMRPAVIVMDVTMPVLDGIEATRLIKASDAMRHARVIAYIGNSVDGLGQFAAVVKKPATPADLLATVQHVVNL
jgi:CheY-like chemotaxis protein